MFKPLTAVITLLLCTSFKLTYACPLAADVTSANFCGSFQSVAQCHCTTHGLPARLCTDMNTIYQRMMIVYGSLEQACLHQADTTPQSCVDSWNCYRRGGVTSNNQLCNGTGAACA